MGMQKRVARATQYPVMALRGLVVFPDQSMTFEVAREKSVKALETAVNGDQCLLLVCQKDMALDHPTVMDLYPMGTVARVRQVVKLPNDSFRIAVDGLYRARIREVIQTEPCLFADVRECLQRPILEPMLEKALLRECRAVFEEYIRLSGEAPDSMAKIASARRGGALADAITAALPAPAANNSALADALFINSPA